MKKTAISLLLILLCGTAQGRDLPTAKPERVGMSAERLQRITEMNRRYTDAGKIIGTSTAVMRDGKIVYFETSGNKGANDSRALAKSDLFRIYSMTKPITAVAAMQLYEQGKFQLSDPVEKYVPELKDLTVLVDGERVPVKTKMTMQHLLSHTAGLSYGFNAEDPVDKLYQEAHLWQADDLDDLAARLGNLPLKYEPGERWHYSVAVDVTGLVVQRLSGKPFDQYLEDHLFEPLGMVDTFFSVPEDKLERFLPNHVLEKETGKPRLINPEAEDTLGLFDGCRAMCDYRNVTLFSGGGGLVSTTMDYLRFAEALRNGGELHGNRILSPKTVKYMSTNHLPASVAGGSSGEQPSLGGGALNGFGFGLGFGIITDTAASAVMGSVGEYYWGGAAGTVFWIDPVEDFVVVSMMQLMRGWPSYRPELKVATNQALLESKQ